MNLDLTGLKDIHLPEKPPFFPLAWGWWLLLPAIILAVLLLVWIWQKIFYSPKRYVQKRLAEIAKMPSQEFVRNLNILAKQVAISRFGRKKIAPLYGQDWIDFLNKCEKVHFSKEYVEILEKNMYASKQDLTALQKEQIFKTYSDWILTTLKGKEKE